MSSALALDQPPTYPHALIGYRAWKVTKEGALKPLHQGPTWRPGVNLAYCQGNEHVAPDSGCGCGFNAYYSLESLNRLTRDTVIGAIAAKGDVELHKRGFRCESAQIIGLVDLDIGDAIYSRKIARASERYQVPVYENGPALEEALSEITGASTIDSSTIADLPETSELDQARPIILSFWLIRMMILSWWMMVGGAITLLGLAAKALFFRTGASDIRWELGVIMASAMLLIGLAMFSKVRKLY